MTRPRARKRPRKSKKSRKTTLPTPEVCLAEYNRGLSMVEIAKKYHCGPSSVYHRLHAHPEYSRAERFPFTSAQWAFIRKLRAQRWSLAKIAEAMRCPPSRVYYWLKRKDPDYQPQPRQQVGRPSGMTPRTQDILREILDLRAAGWTYQVIGDHLGFSRQYIQQLVTREGGGGKKTKPADPVVSEPN